MRVFKIVLLAVLLSGCALNPGENRRVTAWGVWMVALGSPIGIGYWHSERGPDVKSEESAKPPAVPGAESPTPTIP